MLISNSLWRKLLATLAVVTTFVFLYETRILDSRFGLHLGPAADVGPLPTPGSQLSFGATAYCKGTTTASGVNVRSGMAAADPDLLPVGSVIQVEKLADKYNGIYTVMDTGPKVKGRHIDIYMWNCDEALVLGRRAAGVTVLRLGWNPKASTPSLVDRLFRQRELKRPIRAASPVPVPVPAMPAATVVPGGPGLTQK